MEWRLAEAKNRFSEVVTRALREGPQKVLRRTDAVVVISLADYENITGKKPGFMDYLTNAAEALSDLDVTRDRSSMRKADL